MIILTIGREDNNRIVLEDAAQLVSNYHAELKIKHNGTLFLYDKSTNGTFVNGVRIPSEQDFPVYRGNTVLFANKVNLNWSLVPEVPVSEDTLRILSIGKNDDNDLHLGDQDRISRYHALLRITKKYEYYLYDMSMNGVFVNNLRIPARTYYKVKYGEQVSFGGAEQMDWKLVPAGKAATPLKKRPILLASAVALILLSLILFFLFRKKDLYREYDNTVCLVVNQFLYTLDFGELGTYDAVLDGKGTATLYDRNKTDPVTISGTGFFISKDGKLVTNRHVAAPWMYTEEQDPDGYEALTRLAGTLRSYVIANAREAANKSLTIEEAMKYERAISAWSNARLFITGHTVGVSILLNNTFFNSAKDLINCQVLKVSEDQKVDIGLLQTNSKTLPAGVKNIVNMEDIVPDKELVPGKKIFILGFPMGLVLAKTSQGIKSNFQDGQVSREPDGYSFGHNVSETGGASGSPVFDEGGRLAGVHFSGIRGEQGFKFAVTASQVRKLLGN